MSTIPSGKLKRVDLRTVWLGEASHFTPWLAQEENLALLSDTVGLELELEAVEKNVGPFRADIVCKDTVTGSWVLIENQLERTDHSHLGQLLTYAAGLNTVTIVWIAERFTDEHRAALDWLNEVTSEEITLFGLEVELWRIGDSAVAPKFNVVSQPNDWTKTVTATRRTDASDLTPAKQLQLEYWTALRQYLEDHNSFMKSQKPSPQHWTNFAIGRSNFYLVAGVNTQQNRISVQLVLDGQEAKPNFYLLQAEKGAIEQEFGGKLRWRELSKRKQSRIDLDNTSFDLYNRAQWSQQHAWLQQTLEGFHKIFASRIKTLDAADYAPLEEKDLEEQ
ncbi:MAG: DUF4268 domain-containing protein [Ardenticatenaceae bacterium]|nr:DUF4268 domain-containing protein [Ardenticatenaceae bacterium]